MAPETNADADAQTETLRDVYGAINPDDVEAREDWDPALEPEGLVPETAVDGRKFTVAAWDGGVSDLEGLDDMNIYDVREGAPAVVVYLSTHGGVQVFEGELTSDLSGYGRRVEVRDGDDVREVVNVDGQDRYEAVRTDTGRHVGTMLDVRLTRPWDTLADYHTLPDGVDTLYEVVEVYDDREEVVAVEPSRDAANQARAAHTVAYGEEEPTGLLVRERGADDEGDVEDDDDDDDGEPTFQYDESDMASLPDVDDALEAAINDEGDDDARTDGGEVDVEEPGKEDMIRDVVPTLSEGDVLVLDVLLNGDTTTRKLTVDSAEVTEFDTHTGYSVETVDDGPHATTHGRLEDLDVNTSGDFPVYLYTGTTTMKSRQNRDGRVVRVRVRRDDGDDDDARTDGGRPVEDNRRGVAGDPVPDAEYGDGPEDLTPDVDPAEGGHIPPGETPDHIPSPTAPDRDSPVEWTGRAHLVTTSCSECGESVEVPEGRAEQAARGLEPVTCDDCTHDCLNAAADHLTEAAPDPALPPHIVPYSCEACGQRLLFDTETGEHEVDA